MTNKIKATKIAVEEVKLQSYNELQKGVITGKTSFILKAFINEVYKDVLANIKYTPVANSRIINTPFIDAIREYNLELDNVKLPSILLPMNNYVSIMEHERNKLFSCALSSKTLEFTNGRELRFTTPNTNIINCIYYYEPSVIDVITKILNLIETDIVPKTKEEVIDITSSIVYLYIFRSIMHELCHIYIALNIAHDTFANITLTGCLNNSTCKMKNYGYDMFIAKDDILQNTQETDADMISAMSAINMFHHGVVTKEELMVMLIAGYRESVCFILKDMIKQIGIITDVTPCNDTTSYEILFICAVFLYIKKYKNVPNNKSKITIDALNINKLQIKYSLFDYCNR